MKTNCLLLVFLLAISLRSLSTVATGNYNTKDSNIVKLHFLDNSAFINPAYTGVEGGHNLRAFGFIDKPMFTFAGPQHVYKYNFIYDFAFGKNKNDALGAYYSHESAFLFFREFGLTYARNFNLFINEDFYHKLRVGVRTGFEMGERNFKNLTFPDQIDTLLGFIWNTSTLMPEKDFTSLRFEVGLWYHNPVFYLGLSTNYLQKPDYSFYGVSLPIREYILSTGGHIHTGDDFLINPSLKICFLDAYNGKLNRYTPSVNVAYKNKVFAGLGFRNLNSLEVIAGGKFLNYFTLSALCGVSIKNDMTGFGVPLYLGAHLNINLK